MSTDEEDDTYSDVEIVTIEDIRSEEKKEGGKNFRSGQQYLNIRTNTTDKQCNSHIE